MKKSVKILVAIMLMVSMVMMATYVFAEPLSPEDFSGSIEKSTDFNEVGGKIVGMIQAIGTIVAVGVLIVLGIKYMMGSAEEKAEYKKTMLPYLIGAILIFAASTIANVIYNFANSL